MKFCTEASSHAAHNVTRSSKAVTEVQPLGSALLQGGIAFLFYVIPFGIGKRAFGAGLGGTTLPPDPGSLRCVIAPIPSRAVSEHFWD